MFARVREALTNQSTHTGLCMLAIMGFLAALHFKIPLEEVENAIQHGVGILIAVGGVSAAMKVLLPDRAAPPPVDSAASGEGGNVTLPKG